MQLNVIGVWLTDLPAYAYSTIYSTLSLLSSIPSPQIAKDASPVCLLQKPLTETALLYTLDHLINAIGSQQVSALDKLIWLDECYVVFSP